MTQRAQLPFRILLVEDDRDNRELTQELLEADGYEVVATGSSADALRVAEAGGISVLLTDVGLPDLSGIDLAERVRQLLPGIAVILLTGYSITSHEAAGAVVLEKPVEIADLAKAIELAWQQARERDSLC